jgi:ABC-type transport system involved in multi-copper enzyme maturation permease subunit
MNWLLWKEYRQNRLVVWVTLAFLVVPYLVALCATWWEAAHGMNLQWRLVENLSASSFYCLCFGQLALALIGGNAIAGERADRSAEFQAYLPIRRGKIVVAKLMLSLAIAALIWLPNLLSLLALAAMVDSPSLQGDLPPMLPGLFINVAATGLTFFCVAWFLSSFIRSPAISVLAGFVTPPLIAATFLYAAYIFYQPWVEHYFEPVYRSVCLAVAPACFVAGTWIYLRRVEP